jgi:phage terminase large subunit-like protein
MAAKGLRFSFQTRVPHDYVAKTLKRLLPDASTITSLTRDQLIALAAKKKQLTHLISNDPSRFFQPNIGGQKAFLTYWDTDRTKKVLLFLAGNKTGKTTGGCLLMGERLLGYALWDRDNRKDVSYSIPAVGICFTEDFESHRDTILPTILSWWPKNEIKRVIYTTGNCPSELELHNGSTLKFKTYAQGSDTAEGKDWDRVWCDEPPPNSVYTAAFRGIVSRGGDLYITATLLKEAWIADEVDQPYAAGFRADIHDNKWIASDVKEAFLSALSDEEREVRESGKPFSVTGVIYKSFRDDAPYVIEPFSLPEKWPYFIGVDPHERRPVHILFGTVTPENEIIWINYALIRGSVEEIFEQLRAKEREIGIPYPVRIAVMDPNRGKATQINKTSWEEEFSNAGYDVILGNDNLNIGHSRMYDFLKLDLKTRKPRMMFTYDCRGKYGPIWQMTRYAWDEWVGHGRTRLEKDAKEKPRQFNKDFPDICRYTAMEEFDFDTLLHGPKVLRTVSDNFRPYGQVTPRYAR